MPRKNTNVDIVFYPVMFLVRVPSPGCDFTVSVCLMQDKMVDNVDSFSNKMMEIAKVAKVPLTPKQ